MAYPFSNQSKVNKMQKYFKNSFITKKIGKNKIKYYFLGIRIWKKNTKTPYLELEKKIQKLNRSVLKNEILLLNLYYNSINSEKLILCIDALHDKYAEAIDGYTFFKFLQEKNIPSKYILLKENPLYSELQKQNKLKDIIPVQNENDFLETHTHIIAKTKCILTSYGLTPNDNIFLKSFPFLDYIFIEHGVTLLKKWVINLYNTNAFDKILVPTQATYDFYKSKNLYDEDQIIKIGFPRWDQLKKETSETKNIFLFFTWRYTKNKNELNVYFNKINELIRALNHIAIKNNNLKIYLAMHHAFLNAGFDMPQYNNVEFISTTDISKMIGKTDLLITDYSSICFDFMYLNIPVIFYRFDADVDYSDPLNKESLLSAKKEDEKLYNCFYNLNDTITKIDYYIANNFDLEKENKEKNKRIFWENKKNCETLKTYIEKRKEKK